MANRDNVTIIWIGRFIRSGGYGVATRSMYRAIQDSGMHVIGIDVDTNLPIDDSAYPFFSVSGGGSDSLEIEAVSEERFVVTVYHELPTTWHRLSISGRNHAIGYTVTETEQIPFAWTKQLLAMDRVWVATDFNRNAFEVAGIPSDQLSVMPHAIDTELFIPSENVIPLVESNSFRFLHVVSNFNRKDLGGIIRAFSNAFDSTDDVSLVIKLPSKSGENEMRKFLQEASYPWVDLDSSSIPHITAISGCFSDEKMVDLYRSCHAYVSLERGKGWDLPSIEAMLMGLPSMGINWGGNTQFQTYDNSVLIEPCDRTVFASEDLVLNKELYAGNTWAAFSLEDATNGLRKLYTEYRAEKEKVIKARCEIEKKFSLDSVAQLIDDYVTDLEPFQFRSNEAAKLTLKNSNCVEDSTQDVRYANYHTLSELDRETLEHDFQKGEDVSDWVKNRRSIWGKRGPVLTHHSEQLRLKSLKNKYYGESIFVVGNGPSLNEIDLPALKDYYTIAANKIYLLFDKTDWRPDFYTTLDWRVTPDCYSEINSLNDMTFLFPHRFRGLLREGEDVFWYESLSPGSTLLEKFESDINKGVRGGGTVLVAALQQAYYLGFRKIFLIGVDVSYTIPDSVIQSGGDRFGTGIQLNLESTQNDDPNHFDSRYFGKGAKWHDPNINEMMRGFRNASLAIDYLGGELFNSTVGGNLNCIQRMPITDAFNYADKKR